MANRFLDSNYYKSPFVRSLKGSLKSLYSFIICDCDGAGIWNLDMQAATLYTGFEQTTKDFEDHFVMKGKAYPIGGNKYFFPDFIEHQYPKGLKAQNPAHKNFISILKKYDLLDQQLNVILKGALKGLPSPIGNGLSNGNGQGNGNGVDRGLGKEFTSNAEETILKKAIWFEQICAGRARTLDAGKEALRKYHLYLQENEKYPRTISSVEAGFEKWLMNEKNFIGNGTKTASTTGTKPIPKINPTGGFGKL